MPQFLKTKLFSFQKDTIEWMISHEKQFGGGFLLNEPGTGKSIICLGLCAPGETNLIVCPAGLITNWQNEIQKHFCDFPLENIICQKSKQNATNNLFPVFFIVSYTTLARRLQLDESMFMSQTFDRIFLDEAHYIRNRKTQAFNAVMELTSQYRWVVTATPIFNKIDDLHAYFTWLNLRDPVLATICTESDLILLNRYLKSHSICKRKTKGFVQKKETVVSIPFSQEEQEFYDAFKEFSQTRLQKMYALFRGAQSKGLQSLMSSNILVYILRLKQCCNHPQLIMNSIRKQIKQAKTIQLAAEQLRFYNQSKKIEEECPICYDEQADLIIGCGHKFCKGCWEKLEKIKIRTCPVCRTRIDPALSQPIQDLEDPDLIRDQPQSVLVNPGSKIQKMKDLIRSILARNEKVVVVSQWVSMLDLVKKYIDEPFLELNGSVSFSQRKSIVDHFNEQNSEKILLLSMASSAEGINLVGANNMIILDNWWNQSKITQVSDRIHRIGQTKDVSIVRLQMEYQNAESLTIEQLISELVSQKSKLSNLLMSRTRPNKGLVESIMSSFNKKIEFKMGVSEK